MVAAMPHEVAGEKQCLFIEAKSSPCLSLSTLCSCYLLPPSISLFYAPSTQLTFFFSLGLCQIPLQCMSFFGHFIFWRTPLLLLHAMIDGCADGWMDRDSWRLLTRWISSLLRFNTYDWLRGDRNTTRSASRNTDGSAVCKSVLFLFANTCWMSLAIER
jgi:hypothetical protein